MITTRDTGFTFTVDDPTATVQCRLVPDAWGPCTAAGIHALTGLADGRHTFQVRAVDAAGNEGATGRSLHRRRHRTDGHHHLRSAGGDDVDLGVDRLHRR